MTLHLYLVLMTRGALHRRKVTQTAMGMTLTLVLTREGLMLILRGGTLTYYNACGRGLSTDTKFGDPHTPLVVGQPGRPH